MYEEQKPGYPEHGLECVAALEEGLSWNHEKIQLPRQDHEEIWLGVSQFPSQGKI